MCFLFCLNAAVPDSFLQASFLTCELSPRPQHGHPPRNPPMRRRMRRSQWWS